MNQATAPASDPADNLIRVTTRLSELMEHEIALLRDMRARDIEALQTDKQALAAVYRRLMVDVQQNPAALGALSDDRRNALEAAARRMEAAASGNAIALHAAMEANHRLMQAIAEAVDERKTANMPYTNAGLLAGRPGAAAPAPVAVTVNQTL